MTMRIIMWTLKLLDKVLYSKSIAGRGIARLISRLGTAGPVDCFNTSVSDCYIRVYRSFLAGYSQLLVGPTIGYAQKTRHSTNPQNFRSLLV